MTAVLSRPTGFPLWAVRHARVFLVAMHVPFAAVAPLFMFTRHPHLSVAAQVVVVGRRPGFGRPAAAAQLRGRPR